MGMPRKGSRLIEVDGQKFRWMLSCRKRQYRWDDPRPPRTGGQLTIQEEHERPGHVLIQHLSWLDGTSVTPEIIRTLIRRALHEGWKPSDPKMPSEIIHGKCIDVETIETSLSIVREIHDL